MPTITLTENDDRFYGTHSPGNDEIFGLGGDDVIGDGYGDDIVHGGEGNDRLGVGEGGGHDVLYGEAGNDVLLFADEAYGGEGNDRFFYGGILAGGIGDDWYFANTGDGTTVVELAGEGFDVCEVNGYQPNLPAPFVSCDDREAGELAVAHLVALGHRRIGLITGPGRFVPVQRKVAGFKAAMKRLVGLADAELDELAELSLFGVEGGEVAAARLLDRGVTGLVCGSDLMALGAIRAARQRGLSVPTDLSVVGYDDSPLMAFTDPPLTTMRQPVTAMAVAAVRALVDEIHGHAAPHSEYIFRPELVVRGSTAVAPGLLGTPAQQPRPPADLPLPV